MRLLPLDVRGPVQDDAERIADRARLQALVEEEKYQEVIEYVDSVFGWAPGELEKEFGQPRQYTRKQAADCIGML